MTEVWQEIYGGYSVSNFGNVRNRTRILKKHNIKGRNIVVLRKGRGVRNETVARLVAQAFIPNHDGKRFVRHRNGNNLDDRAENLIWVDVIKKWNNPRRGEDHGRALLSRVQTEKIKLLKKEMTYKEIARMYNVSIGCIQGVVSGNNWK